MSFLHPKNSSVEFLVESTHHIFWWTCTMFYELKSGHYGYDEYIDSVMAISVCICRFVSKLFVDSEHLSWCIAF